MFVDLNVEGPLPVEERASEVSEEDAAHEAMQKNILRTCYPHIDQDWFSGSNAV